MTVRMCDDGWKEGFEMISPVVIEDDDGQFFQEQRSDLILSEQSTRISSEAVFNASVFGVLKRVSAVQYLFPVLIFQFTNHVRVQQTVAIVDQVWVVENESFVGEASNFIVLPNFIRIL